MIGAAYRGRDLDWREEMAWPSHGDIHAIARSAFGLDVADLSPLAGYKDHNVCVTTTDGTCFVLKLHHPTVTADSLELQDLALDQVATQSPTLGGPRVVGSTTAVDPTGDTHVVRLLTWVDGAPVAEFGPDSRPLWELGRAVARTDEALAGLDHPGLDRPHDWNMLQVDRLPPEGNPWADDVLAAAVAELVPALASLPQVAIHNDANDHNAIVTADGSVVLIDYGDVVRGPRIISLGVAIAYAMFDQRDPLQAAAKLVAGHHHEAPLDPGELALLDSVVRTRLAMSINNARRQTAAAPDNDYITTSQDAIHRLVDLLDEIEPARAHAVYRHACGYLPVAAQRDVQRHFQSANFDPHPIIAIDLSVAPIIDWSTATDTPPPAVPSSAPSSPAPGTTSPPVVNPSAPSTPAPGTAWPAPGQAVASDATTTAAGAPATIESGVGRYGEHRAVYATDDFVTPSGEARIVHLGMDLFAPVGTTVSSPLAGTVVASDVRPRTGDYGGVVLVEYATPGGTPFWLLFGHLAPASILDTEPGARLERGDAIGSIGAPAENGGWVPHVHVQLATDLLGHTTDLDGVARASEEAVWRSISPDPTPLLVGLDPATSAILRHLDAETIMQRRRARLSTSLSTSYDEPLHIVAGDGATLIDADGRRWLDLVNNVAHVGHEHPRVVAALTTQARRLNTNTRYLHGSIVAYADRLASLFPDPLSVVFMTNSGSESVDLTLRLARAATGRDGVLTMDWAYHGNLSSTIAISPYKFNRGGGRGCPDHVRVCDLPGPYRGAHGDDGPAYAADVAGKAAALTADGHPPMAFVHESISGCGGQVELATGYLAAAYAHARAAGAVCIADEVQCGFGRVGTHWWAFEAHGVVPDIVALGKPIGNGHPMGAVVTTPAIARAFRNGMEYFNTYGGNPVSARVGMAVLDVLHDERLLAHADRVGTRLRQGLDRLADHHDLIGDVRGRGLFLGVELVTDRVSRQPATAAADAVVETMKAHGVLCSTDGPFANVLKFKPPMVITETQVDEVVDVLDDALAAVAATKSAAT